MGFRVWAEWSMEIANYLAELTEEERAGLLREVLLELGKHAECRGVTEVRWLGIERGLILGGRGLGPCAESMLPKVVREVALRHRRAYDAPPQA